MIISPRRRGTRTRAFHQTNASLRKPPAATYDPLPLPYSDETIVTDASPLHYADINEILKHIPHRYPFLLIDRLEACEPNRSVRVIKNVSANDWFFYGLAPEQRLMPQMLVVEALAQAAGVLCHYSGMMSRIGKSIIFFAGLEKCAFGRDPRPGDCLVLECTMKRSLRGVAKLTGLATVDGDVVVRSNLSAVIRDMDPAAEQQLEV